MQNASGQITAGANMMRLSCQQFALGLFQVAQGVVRLVRDAAVSVWKHLVRAAVHAFTWINQRLSDARQRFGRYLRERGSALIRALISLRQRLWLALNDKRVWLGAAIAPLAFAAIVQIMTFLSDTDRVRSAIKEHPVAASIIVGSLLVVELVVLAIPAFKFLRLLAGGIRRQAISTRAWIGRSYQALPQALRRAISSIPRIAYFCALALQVAAAVFVCWQLFDHIPVTARPMVLGGIAAAVILGVSVWLTIRFFGDEIADWFSDRRDQIDELVSGVCDRLANWRDQIENWRIGILRRAAERLLAAWRTLHELRRTKIELAFVAGRGGKATPGISVAVLDASVIGFAIVSLAFFSFSGIDNGIIQITVPVTFVSNESEAKPKPKPKPLIDLSKMGHDAGVAWFNASRSMNSFFESLEPTQAEFIDTMAEAETESFAWKVGSAEDYERLSKRVWTPITFKSLCSYDVLVAFGTASSDGRAEKNSWLAQMRSLSTADLLRVQSARCFEPPHVVSISLGTGKAQEASADQRKIAVVGLKHQSEEEIRALTAQNARRLMERFPGLRPYIDANSDFMRCYRAATTTENRRIQCAR